MNIRLSGQVIWQDWNGRAGVQFVDVPKTSRRMIDEFLAVNLPSGAQGEQFSDVTVEVEEPLPVATVSAAEQTHGSEKSRGGAQTAAAVQSAKSDRPEAELSPEASPDANNRRTQTRYACRLGAEVYRTGSPVPHHCCLTDLSSGGCYLEVPLPFPTGSGVEILVRTHEIKLRLRGMVQAAHPGYGMGVAFELKTKEERDNVKRLTDFVAASANPSN